MKRFSRLTTAVGAFTLGMGLLGTSFAMADPSPAPKVPEPVKPGNAVSMTIVKYSGPEVEGNARPQAPQQTPLKGITFTVTRIDYQGSGTAPTIGTADWWEWAYSQKAGGPLNNAAKANTFTLTTDEKGQACLSSATGMETTSAIPDKVQAGTTCTRDAEVKQGLYLVEETGTKVGDKKYRGALPFFITLPLAEPAAQSADPDVWNYDPIIEPKNQEFSTDKKLTNVEGNKAVYTVSTSIPASGLTDTKTTAYNEKYPFGIEDVYPTALTATTEGVEVFAKAEGEQKEKVALTAGTDYVVALKGKDDTKVGDDIWEGSVVKGKASVAVYFTKAGAKKLADALKAEPTSKVYFSLPFTVKDQDATITNKLGLHNPGSKAIPDPEETTNSDGDFINLKITKVDAQNNANKLKGAVFNFYKCSDDGNGNLTAVGKALPGFATAGDFKNAPENATYDFTTADNTGEVIAYHVVNAAKVTKNDNSGVPTATKYVMCAVEKTAPEGYKKNPYPIKVDTAAASSGAEVAKTITNTPATFFDRLPKTGAAGIVLLLVLGGAMLIAGVTMRRRSGEEA